MIKQSNKKHHTLNGILSIQEFLMSDPLNVNVLQSAAAIHQVSNVLATTQHRSRGTCALTLMMSSILDHGLLLDRGILPADLLRKSMSWIAAVFLLAFTNWLVSLAVGRTRIRIRRLINWQLWSFEGDQHVSLDRVALQMKIWVIL